MYSINVPPITLSALLNFRRPCEARGLVFSTTSWFGGISPLAASARCPCRRRRLAARPLSGGRRSLKLSLPEWRLAKTLALSKWFADRFLQCSVWRTDPSWCLGEWRLEGRQDLVLMGRDLAILLADLVLNCPQLTPISLTSSLLCKIFGVLSCHSFLLQFLASEISYWIWPPLSPHSASLSSFPFGRQRLQFRFFPSPKSRNRFAEIKFSSSDCVAVLFGIIHCH